MEPYVIITTDGDRRLPLVGKATWTVGRSADNDIVIDNRWISRRHAILQRLGGDASAIYLIDLGSHNGSKVNGRQVASPVELSDGDRIAFGGVELLFHAPPAVPAPGDGSPSPNYTVTAAMRERRLLTILVVDIRDFTTLVRTADNVLLAEVIAAFHERATRTVRAHGSWGEKSTGDGLMAIWLHPTDPDATPQADPAAPPPARLTIGPRPDPHVLRALSGVAALADVVHALGRELRPPVPLRIGAAVNTGLATVGNVGRGEQPEYTAVGDTVNLAFRLESATRSLGTDLILGQGAFERLTDLNATTRTPFRRHSITLKGFDGERPAHACTFEELRAFLASLAPPAAR